MGDRIAIDIDIVLTEHDDSFEGATDDRGSEYKEVEEGYTDWVMIPPKGVGYPFSDPSAMAITSCTHPLDLFRSCSASLCISSSLSDGNSVPAQSSRVHTRKRSIDDQDHNKALCSIHSKAQVSQGDRSQQLLQPIDRVRCSISLDSAFRSSRHLKRHERGQSSCR